MGRLFVFIAIFVAGILVAAYLLGREPGELIDLAKDKIEELTEDIKGFIEDTSTLAPVSIPSPTTSDGTDRPIRPLAPATDEVDINLVPVQVFNTLNVGLRVRSSPYLSDENIIGRAMDGTIMQSDGRTQAADGYVWQNVSLQGWVASDYLNPAAVLGTTVRVTDTEGLGLRVRTTPRIIDNNNILGRLGEGTTVLILDGPQEADGYRWYRILLAGWSASEYLRDPVELSGGQMVVTTDDRKGRLERQYEGRLQTWPPLPDYLLNPDSFQKAMAVTGLTIMDLITRTNPIRQYNDGYNMGIQLDGVALSAFLEGRRALRDGGIDRAEELYERCLRLQWLSYQSFIGAAEYLNQNFEVAQELFDSVRRGSQTAVKFGLHFVNPKAAVAADYLFVATDYAIERVLLGTDEADRNLVTRLVIKAVIKEMPFDSLGGKTVEAYLTDATADKIDVIIRSIVSSAEGQDAITQVLTQLAAEGIQGVTEQTRQTILDNIVRYIAEIQHR